MSPDLILAYYLQLLGESLHCVGMLQLCCSARLCPASDCPRSFSLCHHCATGTRLSEAGSPFSWTVRSFFLCSSNSHRILSLTVFCLIDLCDKEQKKERLRRRLEIQPTEDKLSKIRVATCSKIIMSIATVCNKLRYRQDLLHSYWLDLLS